jgi:D-alanyl-lipoteichoic acid acyltransferase DltB (MBOAT superfamily)
VGYVKKACIADNIAGIIDPVFASPSAYHASDVLLAASGYSIQIYCDFSGYTDIAIATAGMLGFKLCRNFDAPYLSTNVREFWRRWHMSLSTWLRDYLYVSLGGGRGTRFQMYRNLLITMVLGGLWHGAKLTFVLWGLAHGLALVLHRALGGVVPWKRWLPWLPIAALGWACTLGWVVLLFTLFRCDSVATFSALCSRLSAWDDATLSGGLWLLIAALGVVHFALHRFRAQIVRVVTTMRAAGYAFLLGAGISLALFFTSVVTAPFIYFQF